MARLTLRQKIGLSIAGMRQKSAIIPSLPRMDGFEDAFGTQHQFRNHGEMLQANLGWVANANRIIAETTSSIELKLYKRNADGDYEEVTKGGELEVLELLKAPSTIHNGGEQRELHYTYLNLTGESYQLMIYNGQPYQPHKGQLPDAIQVLPTQDVDFELNQLAYSESTVKINQTTEFTLKQVMRQIRPDPQRPYYGRSVITEAAQAIDTDWQMKEWNRGIFARGARPSMVFSSNQPLDDKAYERWKEQFQDEHTGTRNAHTPLLIEGGTVTPLMLTQQDLDFLNSRKFSRDEIFSMFLLNPALAGITENANRAIYEAAWYHHAIMNMRPRVQRFCFQYTQQLIQPVFGKDYALGFVDPVPEDTTQKLQLATQGVNKFLTIDEARDMYGMESLPDGIGENLLVPNLNTTLDALVEAAEAGDTAAQAAADKVPPAKNDDDGGDDPDDDTASKSLAGVKKKQLTAPPSELRRLNAALDRLSRTKPR